MYWQLLGTPYVTTAIGLDLCCPVPKCLGSEVSYGHFGSSADMSGQFGTGVEVSYGQFGTRTEMSWVRSVLGPKCLYTV